MSGSSLGKHKAGTFHVSRPYLEEPELDNVTFRSRMSTISRREGRFVQSLSHVETLTDFVSPYDTGDGPWTADFFSHSAPMDDGLSVPDDPTPQGPSYLELVRLCQVTLLCPILIIRSHQEGNTPVQEWLPHCQAYVDELLCHDGCTGHSHCTNCKD